MKPDSKCNTGTENTMAEENCKIRSDCASRKSALQIGAQKKTGLQKRETQTGGGLTP